MGHLVHHDHQKYCQHPVIHSFEHCQHLLDHHEIVDIEAFNHEVMNIFASDVLAGIRSGQPGWEAMVPVKVATVVKEGGLFGGSAR